MNRATALSPPDLLRLDLWATAARLAFDSTPYLVGSVLTSRDYRDVDVRLPLPDDDPIFADADRLRFLNVAVSTWGQQATGLPIDFQFQREGEFVAEKGQVNPLGDRWAAARTREDT